MIQLASWGERFLAYLIDVIIVNVFLTPLGLVFPWTTSQGFPIGPAFFRWIPFFGMGFSNVILFLYWTFLEGTYGQSLGKMVTGIRVTRLNGDPVDIASAALESVGKSFLLALDIILGWILYPRRKQRLFSYLAGTIVTKASIHRSG